MNRSIFRLSAASILACMTLMTGLLSCTKSVEPYVICTGEDYREGSWYAFRKAFEWKGDPSEATLTIEADTKYWLWVNGELVVREGNLKRGPNPTDGYFDYFDTLPGLVRGHNEVAVLVNFHGRKSVNHITTPTAGLMFDLRTRSKAAGARPPPPHPRVAAQQPPLLPNLPGRHRRPGGLGWFEGQGRADSER